MLPRSKNLQVKSPEQFTNMFLFCYEQVIPIGYAVLRSRQRTAEDCGCCRL